MLESWAEAIVTSYAEILKIEPLVSSSLLIASLLDPEAAETSEEVRARNAQVSTALRTAARSDEGGPDTDPLEAGVLRWLRVVHDADQRAAILERLLAQIPTEAADALRDRLSGA